MPGGGLVWSRNNARAHARNRLHVHTRPPPARPRPRACTLLCRRQASRSLLRGPGLGLHGRILNISCSHETGGWQNEKEKRNERNKTDPSTSCLLEQPATLASQALSHWRYIAWKKPEKVERSARGMRGREGWVNKARVTDEDTLLVLSPTTPPA